MLRLIIIMIGLIVGIFLLLYCFFLLYSLVRKNSYYKELISATSLKNVSNKNLLYLIFMVVNFLVAVLFISGVVEFQSIFSARNTDISY